MCIATFSLITAGVIVGTSFLLEKTNANTNNDTIFLPKKSIDTKASISTLEQNLSIPLSCFSQVQSSTIALKAVPFEGTVLTKAAVIALGWDQKETITLEDWEQWAPNVTKITPDWTNDSFVSDGAFWGRTILKEIEIPAKIIAINYGSFSYSSLTKITFEANSQLTSIDGHAFFDSKITSITIPKSVQWIGINAFRNTYTLSSITFEENGILRSFGTQSFSGTGLTSINIPDSVTEIGNNAFEDTTNLLGNQVYMLSSLRNSLTPLYGFTQAQWDNIDWRLIPFEGIILTKADALGLLWDRKTIITFEDWEQWAPNVTHINNAFENNYILESIEIPEKITTITNNSFSNATSLVDITLYYELFVKNQSSLTPLFGFNEEQWNLIKWLNYPKTGIINSIIARELLRENNNVITWDDISLYSGIESEAFKDTTISSLTIDWKDNFIIEENAFLNTQSLTDIQMSNKFNFSEDDLLSFGFTLEQINKIKILNSTIYILIISGLASMIIISIGAILGIILVSKNKQKNKQNYIYENIEENNENYFVDNSIGYLENNFNSDNEEFYSENKTTNLDNEEYYGEENTKK